MLYIYTCEHMTLVAVNHPNDDNESDDGGQ